MILLGSGTRGSGTRGSGSGSGPDPDPIKNLDPDPAKIDLAKIKAGMPVELVYKQAPWGDEKGNNYLMFYFQPKK